MLAVTILGLSIVLQFFAAAAALRLIRITGRWRAWSFIAVALTLMGVRRSITFFRVVSSDASFPADITAELVALSISVLMISGVLLIGPVLKRIKQNENRFRSFIDNSPSYIILKGLDGRIQVSNKKHATLFDIESSDVIGKTTFDFLPENIAKIAVGHDRKVLEKKSDITEERQIKTTQGNRDFIITKFPILDELDEAVGVGTIGTDITERKQAEEALQQSEESLRTFIDHAPALVSLKSIAGKYIMINKEYTKQFGFDPLSTIGKGAKNLFPSEVYELFELQEKNVIEGKTAVTQEYTVPHTDGDHVHLCTKFPVMDMSGEVHAIGTISTDITESKEADKIVRSALGEAQRANLAKSEFLAAMSHDLRTPLNAIIGFSNLISNQYFGPLGDKKYLDYAEGIHASGELLLSLVNDILDLSAIESGQQPLAKENISIIDAVTECEIFIKEKAQSLGIDLVTKVSKDLPPLYADRRAVKQILLNLLSNAVKFTTEGGKVTLRATATNKHHTIEISDTGRGIPADKIATITDPFVRGEADPHKSQEGTGLGLAIVKSLVDIHGGELDIKSTVGKGTTVTVTMPNEMP